MAAELPRPGVEVIQEFKSVSPTVVTPTLPPCIVGVCRQVVDVLVPSAAGGSVLNNDALVPLPAEFVAEDGAGDPVAYTGLDGLKLVVSINNSPAIEIPFVGDSLTPAQVVSTVLSAFGNEGVTAATAEVVEDAWRMRTVGTGQFQSLEVLAGTGQTDSAVLSAFGIGPRLYVGREGYNQQGIVLSKASFPDPRSNIEQLEIENSSLRAFLYLGTSLMLQEVLRTESYLRRAASTPAVMTFTGDLDVGATITALDTGTLSIVFNGAASPLVCTFAAPADKDEVVDQVQAAFGSVATAALDDTGKYLVITTNLAGPTASIAIPTGTATGLGFPVAAVVGVTAAKAVSNGSGTNSTSVLEFPGQDFLASAAAPVVDGTLVLTSVADDETLVLDDGYTTQTITFLAAVNPAAILAQINAVVGSSAGGRILASLNASMLRLTGLDLGEDQRVRVVGGTAIAALGLEEGQEDYGSPYPVQSGDELWINGVVYATVTQVAPGGAVAKLKISRSVTLNDDLAKNFYIVAKGLSSEVTATRPAGNMAVDLKGQVVIKPDVLRDTTGAPVPGGTAAVYLSYSAVRGDVTALARNPGLLRFDDTIALGNALSPISQDNPLALGCYFALLNSPGVQVTAIGVDAASESSPFGTVEAFARAATFLESYEVYGIAPMTHDTSVGQVFGTHVGVMSAPENKGERIVLFNPAKPTHRLDTLVASGTNGNSTPTTNVFDTGVQNLSALLLAAGIDATGPISVDDGVWLNVASTSRRYCVVSVSGPLVTVQTSGFTPGQNDDGYFSTSDLSSQLIAEAFAIRVRGAALENVDGTPDKDGIATTYGAMAAGYVSRRFWQIVPDQCAATLDGIEQTINGFYMCAGIVGMIAQQPPQQSFTNFPMTGYTRVIGSSDFFTGKQMNQMAAQGCYIVVQDAQGTPLTARMALTTDMTSIETRTDSITKVVDFTAKFLRRGLRNFIGRFNITQGFLDSLGHVLQGLLGFLTETGVLIGAQLNNIVQDADAPDTVLVDITLDVPFPCNYIRLTLVV